MTDKIDKTDSTHLVESTSNVKKSPTRKPKPIKKVSQEAVTAVSVEVPSIKTDETKNKFQPVGNVKVIKGSILSPHNAGLRFILNIANTAGKTESPLYPVLDKKWPKVKAEVRGSFVTKTGAYKLGTIACITATQSDTWVISLLVQDDELKTDVTALEKSLVEVCKMAKYEKSTCHISTLLTDAIPELTNLVDKCLVKQSVGVNYYEEPGK